MKKKNITQEFKTEALRLGKDLRAQGKSYAHIAAIVGVTAKTIREWLIQDEIDSGDGSTLQRTTAEKQEHARLAKAYREVCRENDFLRQAAAYFAKVKR